jgi:hypothetical protein
MSYAVTEKQIEQFWRDGAILLKGALSQVELDLMEHGVEESLANPAGFHARLEGIDGTGETYKEFLPSLSCPSLQALNERGTIASIAGQLMRTETAHFIFDEIFYKKRGTVLPTPWHQDTPFYSVRGDQLVRVWMSCDPSPRQITVQTLRGSHRWGIMFSHMPAGESQSLVVEEGDRFSYAGLQLDPNAPNVPDVLASRGSYDIMTWDVEPRDVLVFQGNVLHGADGLADHPLDRRVYTGVWGGPELRRYNPPSGVAAPSFADTTGLVIPDGARIGEHEEAYPIGWRAERVQIA